MLGRMVDQTVRRIGDPSSVWGNTLTIWQQADVRFINLECVIARRETGKQWFPKVFHFRALPWALDALKVASIDAVSLANNHVLDYHEEALLEMISFLDTAGIAHAGAGASLSSAIQPAVVESQELTVALLALTDNEPRWEALDARKRRVAKGGIFYVPMATSGSRFERLVRAIRKAQKRADIVVVSAHVGPHMREAPGKTYVSFAHAIIDAGASVYMGSSNHAFQGVEIYRDRPILYDLGDFVDDYAVDPVMRNDCSFLFLLEFQHSKLRSLSMAPTVISEMQVNLARGRERDRIMSRMGRLCRGLGTKTRRVNDRLEVVLD